MTVQFKGISRHQRKHKARRVRNASPHRTMRLAGLSSAQQGICREPQFQSKKRAHLTTPQISSSQQRGDPVVLTKKQITTRPPSPPSMVSVPQAGSVENIETPLAPRPSKPTRTSKTTLVQEESASGHIPRTCDDKETQNQPADGTNHVLRKKAGLKSERQRNIRQSSEYQRQFQWKAPGAKSPLLAAQEMVYSSSRAIPPFKSNPVVMESEYKRSFKGSPLSKGPRLRRDVELNKVPTPEMENISEKSKKKKRRHHCLIGKSSPKDQTSHSSHSKPQHIEQKLEMPQAEKDVSPKVVRKGKTEYRSNFLSPLQYSYRDGAWIRSKNLDHEWYHEVQELHEKAEAYRRRAWGTHFSRDHLGQIMSDQNCLWEVSSGSSPSTLSDEETHSTNSSFIKALDLASIKESCSPSVSVSLAASRRSSCKEGELPSSPTLPAQRRMAWDEQVNPCERCVAETTQRRKDQTEETNVEGNINGHSEDNKEEDTVAVSRHLSHAEEVGCSGDEGRLPTPKLKTGLAAQRTHHDRTTPVTGGAILVSPPKMKHTTRRTEPPLRNANSAYRNLSSVPGPEKIKTEGVTLSHTPPAAGMATVDPLPLREDTWAEDSPEPSPDTKPAKKPPRRKSSRAWLMDSNIPHANRIQGTMRNPEFQHNGNLGIHRTEKTEFPSSDCLSDNDLDDRMSQISFQSAASCSMASQVLDRAQRRKEDFWGKS